MRDDAVTRLLELTQAGDACAREELLAIVHAELHRLAEAQMQGERRAVTLNTTVLVNEAYIRLLGDGDARWNSRRHFFAAAAEAMRRIAVEAARSRQRRKRGAGAVNVGLEAVEAAQADGHVARFGGLEMAAGDPAGDDERIAIHDALDGLAAQHPRPAEVAKYRYFAGLSVDQTAEVLGVSPRTVDSEWRFARSWLNRALGGAAR